MLIIAIIALVLGVVGVVYGVSLNNDPAAKLQSLFEKGSVNPGDTYLYIGIAVAVVGLALLIVSIVKKKK